MVDITEDQGIYPVLAELNACLCTALGDSSPCFCGILVGEVIPTEYVGSCVDEHGEPSCGVAYVRVTGAFPTEQFPDPLITGSCNTIMAYNVSVGILRCASVGEEDGGPVDPEEMEKLTLQLLGDMKAIRRAIQCCFLRAFPDVDHVMGTFTPLPMEGGVAGGEWPIVISEVY